MAEKKRKKVKELLMEIIRRLMFRRQDDTDEESSEYQDEETEVEERGQHRYHEKCFLPLPRDTDIAEAEIKQLPSLRQVEYGRPTTIQFYTDILQRPIYDVDKQYHMKKKPSLRKAPVYKIKGNKAVKVKLPKTSLKTSPKRKKVLVEKPKKRQYLSPPEEEVKKDEVQIHEVDKKSQLEQKDETEVVSGAEEIEGKQRWKGIDQLKLLKQQIGKIKQIRGRRWKVFKTKIFGKTHAKKWRKITVSKVIGKYKHGKKVPPKYAKKWKKIIQSKVIGKYESYEKLPEDKSWKKIVQSKVIGKYKGSINERQAPEVKREGISIKDEEKDSMGLETFQDAEESKITSILPQSPVISEEELDHQEIVKLEPLSSSALEEEISKLSQTQTITEDDDSKRNKFDFKPPLKTRADKRRQSVFEKNVLVDTGVEKQEEIDKAVVIAKDIKEISPPISEMEISKGSQVTSKQSIDTSESEKLENIQTTITPEKEILGMEEIERFDEFEFVPPKETSEDVLERRMVEFSSRIESPGETEIPTSAPMGEIGKDLQENIESIDSSTKEQRILEDFEKGTISETDISIKQEEEKKKLQSEIKSLVAPKEEPFEDKNIEMAYITEVPMLQKMSDEHEKEIIKPVVEEKESEDYESEIVEAEKKISETHETDIAEQAEKKIPENHETEVIKPEAGKQISEYLESNVSIGSKPLIIPEEEIPEALQKEIISKAIERGIILQPHDSEIMRLEFEDLEKEISETESLLMPEEETSRDSESEILSEKRDSTSQIEELSDVLHDDVLSDHETIIEDEEINGDREENLASTRESSDNTLRETSLHEENATVDIQNEMENEMNCEKELIPEESKSGDSESGIVSEISDYTPQIEAFSEDHRDSVLSEYESSISQEEINKDHEEKLIPTKKLSDDIQNRKQSQPETTNIKNVGFEKEITPEAEILEENNLMPEHEMSIVLDEKINSNRNEKEIFSTEISNIQGRKSSEQNTVTIELENEEPNEKITLEPEILVISDEIPRDNESEELSQTNNSTSEIVEITGNHQKRVTKEEIADYTQTGIILPSEDSITPEKDREREMLLEEMYDDDDDDDDDEKEKSTEDAILDIPEYDTEEIVLDPADCGTEMNNVTSTYIVPQLQNEKSKENTNSELKNKSLGLRTIERTNSLSGSKENKTDESNSKHITNNSKKYNRKGFWNKINAVRKESYCLRKNNEATIIHKEEIPKKDISSKQKWKAIVKSVRNKSYRKRKIAPSIESNDD